MAEKQGWKIDKHIPVALLFTLLIHLVGTVWAVAKFTSHIDNLDQEIVQQKTLNQKYDERIETLQGISYSTDKRLAVIEKTVERIEYAVKNDEAKPRR